MKSEKGVTLIMLLVYVIVFSITITLLANLSSYIYGNIDYVKDSNTGISEFNKFNMYFIKSVKTNKQAEVKESLDNSGNNIVQITFEDGDIYRYVAKEKCIYKNKQKIAKNIQSFSAIYIATEGRQKEYIEIETTIGAKDEANYTKKIDYVLKYW